MQIPFNKWSMKRIKEGVKSCTSRHKRYTKDSRVTWISPKLPFWFIKKFLYVAEGALSPKELDEVVCEIYDRKVPDDELFYVHFGDFSKKAWRKKDDI